MHKRKRQFLTHLKTNALVYSFTTVLFFTGIIFGSIVVNSMSFVQKQDLFFYLERFFLSVEKGEQSNVKEILISSFLYHAKYLVTMFLFSLAIIALPLVWIFVFLKGLFIGFSVGFLVNQLGFKGLILAATSIAPQNLLTIPMYIVAGSLSMIFCLTIIKRLFKTKYTGSILEPFTRYLMIYVVLFICAIFSSSIEALFSNKAMELVIKSFYK